MWESFLEGSSSSKSLLVVPVDIKNDKENAILVYGRVWLNVVLGIDGELLW